MKKRTLYPVLLCLALLLIFAACQTGNLIMPEPAVSTPGASSEISSSVPTTKEESNAHSPVVQEPSEPDEPQKTDEEIYWDDLRNRQIFHSSEEAVLAAHTSLGTVALDFVVISDFSGTPTWSLNQAMLAGCYNSKPMETRLWEVKLDENFKPVITGDAEADLLAEAKSRAVWDLVEIYPDIEPENIPMELAWYAVDVEAALVKTFGRYPAEGKSYTNLFDSNEAFNYQPDLGTIIAYGERSSHGMVPQVVSMAETEDGLICDIIHTSSLEYFSSSEEGAISAENFEERTAHYSMYRYTFKRADDGEFIIVGLKTLREGYP